MDINPQTEEEVKFLHTYVIDQISHMTLTHPTEMLAIQSGYLEEYYIIPNHGSVSAVQFYLFHEHIINRIVTNPTTLLYEIDVLFNSMEVTCKISQSCNNEFVNDSIDTKELFGTLYNLYMETTNPIHKNIMARILTRITCNITSKPN